MQFSRLQMKDFRGTHELDIEFEPDMTVIVGRNGAGKTSVLDALVQLMHWFRSQLKGTDGLGYVHYTTDRDVRFGAERFSLELDFKLPAPDSRGFLKDTTGVELDRRTGGVSGRYSKEFRSWWDRTETPAHFLYYHKNRGFETKFDIDMTPATRGDAHLYDPDSVQARALDKYLDALGDLVGWWDGRDADEARQVRDGDPSYRDPQLAAIRRLVWKIDGFSGIVFNSTESPPGLYLLKDNGIRVHAGSLSSGERSYFILLADLARRLQVFAPDMPLEDIPAIVLIDEIDLNLHPAWQSQITTTLAGVFKACQFIVATHSPQVLSGVESRQVRILEEQPTGVTKVSTPLSTRGRTSNYLLEGVLGAPERYPPIERLIDGFNHAIDEGDAVTAAGMLTDIEEEIEEDVPTLLVLRKRLKTLQGGA